MKITKTNLTNTIIEALANKRIVLDEVAKKRLDRKLSIVHRESPVMNKKTFNQALAEIFKEII